MNCRKCRGFLAHYVLGSISTDAYGEIEAHLVLCPLCREEVRELKQVCRTARTWVRRAPEPRPDDVPHSLLRAVMAELAMRSSTSFEIR
jgi:anti-sigma factor RsiW